jgi:hypothetical protein
MKIDISNPATRFLALSAIALTVSSSPTRADWTTVRADGSVVTVSSAPRGQVLGEGEGENADPYASDSFDPADTPAATAGRGVGTIRPIRPRVQNGDAPALEAEPDEAAQEFEGENTTQDRRGRRSRERRGRRNRGNVDLTVGVFAPRITPGFGSYPAYPGYASPGYGYGVPQYGYVNPGYGYPSGVYAPGSTVVLPPGVVSGPIAPPALPFVKPPWFTSFPVGGTTIINTPGYGGYVPPGVVYGQPGYPAGYCPPPLGAPHGVPYTAYPSFPYAYPNGTSTHTYGGLSVGHGGVSVSIGGSRTTTQSTWGTGLYR